MIYIFWEPMQFYEEADDPGGRVGRSEENMIGKIKIPCWALVEVVGVRWHPRTGG